MVHAGRSNADQKRRRPSESFVRRAR